MANRDYIDLLPENERPFFFLKRDSQTGEYSLARRLLVSLRLARAEVAAVLTGAGLVRKWNNVPVPRSGDGGEILPPAPF